MTFTCLSGRNEIVNWEVSFVKKIISLLIGVLMALCAVVPAFAAVKPNKYSLPLEGTVLQNQEDRKINPATSPCAEPHHRR